MNELCWALRHLKKGANLVGEVKPAFWVRYSIAMKFLDAKANFKTLSSFSPGALQKIVRIVAAKYPKISKEVFQLQRKNIRLNSYAADKVDDRIY